MKKRIKVVTKKSNRGYGNQMKVNEENNQDLVLTDKIEIDIIELSKVRNKYEIKEDNYG